MFAQVIAMVAAPFVTRLYEPEDYGTMALFVSLTAIVGLVSCLCYEFAIVLPEKEEDAANILMISLTAVLIVSSAFSGLVWIFREAIPLWLNNRELGAFLWAIPPAVFFTGVVTALTYWSVRSKRFGQISVARVGTSLTTTSTQLGAGFAGHASGGSLISANLIGIITSALILCRRVWVDDGRTLRNSITWRGMKLGARRYVKFPLYETWAVLLNTISWQLPTFLLSAFFSPVVVGYYALGNAVVRMPMTFFGNSIAQVFYNKAVEARREGRLAELVEALFKRLVTWGLFPMLVLTVIGKDAFFVVFGPKWVEAGVFVQILSIWTFFWFISSPMTHLFNALEKQEVSLVWNAINLVTRLCSLLIGGWLHDSRLAVILFACSGVTVYGYLMVKILHLSGVTARRAAGIVFSNMRMFAVPGIMLIALQQMHSSPWVILAVSVAILAVYAIYSVKQDYAISGFLSAVVHRGRQPAD